nr:hypothetical protein [Gemmatimonadota bacterium]
IQLPVGAEKDFRGVIDLVRMRMIIFPESGDGRSFEEKEIPTDLMEEATMARQEMVENAAEFDEHLLDLFVEEKEIPNDLVQAALRKGTLTQDITLVLAGSALKHKGVSLVLDAVVDYLPSPVDIPPVEGLDVETGEPITRMADDKEPLCLMVFKTIAEPTGDLTFVRVYSGVLNKGVRLLNPRTGKHERVGRLLRMHANKRENIDDVRAGDIAAVIGLKNTVTGDTLCDEEKPILLSKIVFPDGVIQMSVEPKRSQDRDKLSEAIGRMMREDPTFRAQTNEATGQLLISGMGELHLEIIVHRLSSAYNIEVQTGKPKVAYKQRLARKLETEARYIRQSGGRGQYAVAWVRFEQTEEGNTQLEFVDAIKGGSIPREYIPSVHHGLKEIFATGGNTGYPFVNVKATLFDGKYHDVDSSEMAFHNAGVLAFRQAMENNITYLEPIMKVLGARAGGVPRQRGRGPWAPAAARSARSTPRATCGWCARSCRSPRCSPTPRRCAARPKAAAPTRWSSSSTATCPPAWPPRRWRRTDTGRTGAVPTRGVARSSERATPRA